MIAEAEEVEETEPEEEDEPPSRVSFFAEGDGVEERICSMVWTLFVKDSNGRGIDARSKTQKLLSAALSRRRTKEGVVLREPTVPAATPANEITNETEEDAMSNHGEDGLTERHRAVLHVVREAAAKGEKLNNPQIADRAKIPGSSVASRGANVSAVIGMLRRRGLIDSPATAATPKPKRTTRLPTSSAPPPAATAEDPLVTELVARRDAAALKVAKLDAAIEALRAAT